MQRKTFITLTYCLVFLSSTFPILYLVAMLLIWPFFAGAGPDIAYGFVVAILGMELCPSIMTIGIILAFLMSLFTREKGLMLVSTFAFAIVVFAFYKAYISSPSHRGELLANVAVVLFDLPYWLYLSFFSLFVIASLRWAFLLRKE